jgi:hypothetical protein
MLLPDAAPGSAGKGVVVAPTQSWVESPRPPSISPYRPAKYMSPGRKNDEGSVRGNR